MVDPVASQAEVTALGARMGATQGAVALAAGASVVNPAAALSEGAKEAGLGLLQGFRVEVVGQVEVAEKAGREGWREG